jgi:sugar phosphate isomerase/epimerase
VTEAPGPDELPETDYLVEPILRLLRERLVAEAVAELDLPHVVICTHLDTGATSIQGPYPDALAAAEAAQRDHDALARDTTPGSEGRLKYTVVPLIEADPTLRSDLS